jgi:hypothetical protein
MPFFLSVVKWCGENSSDLGTREKEGKSTERIENKMKNSKIFENVKETEKEKIFLNEILSKAKVDNMVVNDDEVIEDSIKEEIIIKDSNNIPDDIWKRILGLVRVKNASTEALLRASKPVSFDGKILTLGVYYKFHKEKLESYPHKVFLEDCISGVVGGNIKVECFLTDPEKVINKKDTSGSEISQKFEGGTDMNRVLLSETNDLDILKLVDEVFGNEGIN